MVMELKLVVTWINFHQVQGPVMDDGNKNANKPKCLNSGMQHFELYSMVSVLGTQSNSKDSRFLPLGCIRESEIPVTGKVKKVLSRRQRVLLRKQLPRHRRKDRRKRTRRR